MAENRRFMNFFIRKRISKNILFSKQNFLLLIILHPKTETNPIPQEDFFLSQNGKKCCSFATIPSEVCIARKTDFSFQPVFKSSTSRCFCRQSTSPSQARKVNINISAYFPPFSKGFLHSVPDLFSTYNVFLSFLGIIQNIDLLTTRNQKKQRNQGI